MILIGRRYPSQGFSHYIDHIQTKPFHPPQWLVRAKAVSDMQEACWEMVTQMKGDVLALLDSENDGVRTHAIKFTESLIVTLSPRVVDSDVPKRQESDISLDKVPKDHTYIRYGKKKRMRLLAETWPEALSQLHRLNCDISGHEWNPVT